MSSAGVGQCPILPISWRSLGGTLFLRRWSLGWHPRVPPRLGSLRHLRVNAGDKLSRSPVGGPEVHLYPEAKSEPQRACAMTLVSLGVYIFMRGSLLIFWSLLISLFFFPSSFPLSHTPKNCSSYEMTFDD